MAGIWVLSESTPPHSINKKIKRHGNPQTQVSRHMYAKLMQQNYRCYKPKRVCIYATITFHVDFGSILCISPSVIMSPPPPP